MHLTSLGNEHETKPVTLPELVLPPIENDEAEIAARFATQRIIKNGRDAWELIGNAETFTAWKCIGAALAIGKAHALRVTGANAAWGRNYSAAFAEWNRQHGFDRMAPSVRSVAIELHENIGSIERWRSTLPERQRKRLVHPLSVTRRWKAATTEAKKIDTQEVAAAAWHRFVACVAVLPPEQAAPLWRDAQEQVAAALAPQSNQCGAI
jgi:hypothetical protein